MQVLHGTVSAISKASMKFYHTSNSLSSPLLSPPIQSPSTIPLIPDQSFPAENFHFDRVSGRGAWCMHDRTPYLYRRGTGVGTGAFFRVGNHFGPFPQRRNGSCDHSLERGVLFFLLCKQRFFLMIRGCWNQIFRLHLVVQELGFRGLCDIVFSGGEKICRTARGGCRGCVLQEQLEDDLWQNDWAYNDEETVVFKVSGAVYTCSTPPKVLTDNEVSMQFPRNATQRFGNMHKSEWVM
jgi:hypothetical protein